MKLIRKVARLILIILIITLFLPVLAFSQTAREVVQAALPSVVVIVGPQVKGKAISLGSGFFVQGDVIATNHHVIKGCAHLYIKVVGRGDRYSVAKVLSVDSKRDLALLRVQEVEAPPLSLGESADIEVGDEVYTVGNPEGLEGTFSQGIVSGIRQTTEGMYLQITAPISHGSSGGPVLNRQGKVIGVTVGTIQKGQNLNFAIPAADLSAFISRSASGNNDVERLGAFSLTGLSEIDVAIKQTRTNPKSAEAFYNLGKIYDKYYRFLQAIEAYQRAVKLKPGYSEAYLELCRVNNKGRTYGDEKRQVEAALTSVEACKQAIRIKPENAEAHIQIGIAYRDLRLISDAIAAFKLATKLQPNLVDAYYEWAFLDYVYRETDGTSLSEAVELLKKATQLNPAEGKIWKLLGEIYREMRRFGEAIGAYKVAISLNYGPETYLDLLFTYRDSGRLAEGIEFGRQYTQTKPDDYQGHYFLGLMYAYSGNKLLALEQYKILKGMKLDGLADRIFEEVYK